MAPKEYLSLKSGFCFSILSCSITPLLGSNDLSKRLGLILSTRSLYFWTVLIELIDDIFEAVWFQSLFFHQVMYNDWKLFWEDIICLWYLLSDATPNSIKTKKKSRQKGSVTWIVFQTGNWIHHLDFSPKSDFANTARITTGCPPVCGQPTYALTPTTGQCIPPVMQSRCLV